MYLHCFKHLQSIYSQPPKTQYLNGMTLKTVRGGSGHICVCLCGDTVSVMNNSLRPVVLVVAPGCGCDRLWKLGRLLSEGDHCLRPNVSESDFWCDCVCCGGSGCSSGGGGACTWAGASTERKCRLSGIDFAPLRGSLWAQIARGRWLKLALHRLPALQCHSLTFRVLPQLITSNLQHVFVLLNKIKDGVILSRSVSIPRHVGQLQQLKND